MAPTYSHIETHDELRSHSAVMGMVLFGLKYQRPIPDRDQQLELADSICDIVAEGTQLRQATTVTSFEDLARLNAFSSMERRQRGNIQKLSNMASEALVVKETIRKLKEYMAVSIDELQRAASFFKSVHSIT